jgi:hypothetical protein
MRLFDLTATDRHGRTAVACRGIAEAQVTSLTRLFEGDGLTVSVRGYSTSDADEDDDGPRIRLKRRAKA